MIIFSNLTTEQMNSAVNETTVQVYVGAEKQVGVGSLVLPGLFSRGPAASHRAVLKEQRRPARI